MPIEALGRWLVIAGVVLAGLGAYLLIAGRWPSFVGRLPGDLTFSRDGVTVSVPIVTSLLVSLVLTLILNVFARR